MKKLILSLLVFTFTGAIVFCGNAILKYRCDDIDALPWIDDNGAGVVGDDADHPHPFFSLLTFRRIGSGRKS